MTQRMDPGDATPPPAAPDPGLDLRRQVRRTLDRVREAIGI